MVGELVSYSSWSMTKTAGSGLSLSCISIIWVLTLSPHWEHKKPLVVFSIYEPHFSQNLTLDIHLRRE